MNCVALCITVLSFLGCSEGSTDSGGENPIPGIYYLYGEKIMNKSSDASESDTTGIVLIVKVQQVEQKRDTYRFYGLDGADVSEEGNHRVFPECTIPNLCEVYGALTGQDLLIEVDNYGRTYRATGNIFQVYEPYIRLEAEYKYQNLIITYKIEGDQNVDDERFRE